MNIEERTYDLAPGHLPAYIALVQEAGIATPRPILGRLIGYFHTELGLLNQILYLRAYQSFQVRAERRARLAAYPRWKEYAAKVHGFSLRQQNRILLPMSFSGLGGVR